MKNWMFILADIISLAIIVLYLKTFFIMFGKKRSRKYWINIVVDIIFIAICTIINLFKINQVIYSTMIYVMFLAYSFLYIIKPLSRLFSTILSYVIAIVGEMLIGLLLSWITNMTVEESLENIGFYILNAVVSKLIIFAIVKIISTYIVCKNARVPKLAIMAFTILPLTSFLILYFLSEYVYKNTNNQIRIFAFVLSLLLIISNLIVFFILDYVSKQKDKEKSIESKANQLEYERQYYSDLYEKQVISDKVTHDLKNKFFAFKALLYDDPKKAEKELEEISAKFNDVSLMKITGNIGIDSLLNHKLAIAKKEAINIDVECLISEIKNIDIIDLCVIIGNLLDNSIEACMKLENKEERFVKMYIKQEMKFLQIKISNSYIKTDVVKTSKKDKAHHGFGLQNVKELIEKYNGYYYVVDDNGQYTTIVGVADKND